MRRQVFFENVHHGHLPLVLWYVARGDRVRVFNFALQMRRMGWTRWLLRKGWLERIYIHPCSVADGWAIDAAEWYYPHASGHPVIRRLQKILGSEDADPLFKYCLVQELMRYFYIRLFLKKAREDGELERAVLVPEFYRGWDRRMKEWVGDRLPLLEGIRLPVLVRWWSAIVRDTRAGIQHACLYAACLPSLLFLAAARRLGSKQGASPFEDAAPALAVYGIASTFQTRFWDGRRFDFLLDGKQLRKDNVIFLVEETAEGPWEREVLRKGYRVLRASKLLSLRQRLRFPSRHLPIRALGRLAGRGLLCLLGSDWVHQAAARTAWVLCKESGFWEYLHFRHFIYTNQYGLVPRVRNAWLRRLGRESWYFAYSNGGGFLYREEPFGTGTDYGGRHRYWSYDNVDHFVSPSLELLDYCRTHRQRIGSYHDVGNLWSEQVLEVQRKISWDESRAKWFGKLDPGCRVIAWFDSTFVEAPYSPSSFAEAIQWYGDILRLAEEDPRLRMILKPSKTRAYYVDDSPYQEWACPEKGRELMKIWDRLQEHPRVHFADPATDPTLILAASDLTVTYCYSSVSTEALGARKRAIWSEPGERWRNTLFAQVPDLVAHGYLELRSLVQKLLWETSDEQYSEFLDSKVKNLVESFLDGKGVSRFRALLAGEDRMTDPKIHSMPPAFQETTQ